MISQSGQPPPGLDGVIYRSVFGGLNVKCGVEATQRNTVLRIFLSLRKGPQKNLQNTSKSRNTPHTRKTPQNTVFHKTLAIHHKKKRKTPAKHSAKHHKHKTHLLTKQAELANKPRRSRIFFNF